jgi:formyltetrahydrofolate deformylase
VSEPDAFILTLSCPDRAGIVHAVTGLLAAQGGNISEAAQFNDQATGLFFMRVRFAAPGASVAGLSPALGELAASLSMTWQLHAAQERVPTLIMVSRLGHCLNDLLFRWKTGSLPVEVAGVVSNHPDFAELAASYRIPFRHIPVTPPTKAAAESQLLEVIDDTGADLIVLARYMQILSGEVCKRVEGRMINIHHSFLPSFKGAKPYHQAHARGVKLVGATAHYVTPDLDEGPIIEQDVIRVNHTLSPESLAEAGRDVEAQVLARAVTWHAEHRVLLNGDRTVVFH